MYKTVQEPAARETVRKWPLPGPPRAQGVLFLYFCRYIGALSAQRLTDASSHV